MYNVFRGHQELDRLSDRHVQRIYLALSAMMLDFPHPLLGDDVDFESVGGRLKQSDIEVGSPNEQAEENQQGDGGPRYFDPPRLFGRTITSNFAAGAISDRV